MSLLGKVARFQHDSGGWFFVKHISIPSGRGVRDYAMEELHEEVPDVGGGDGPRRGREETGRTGDVRPVVRRPNRRPEILGRLSQGYGR